MILRLKVVQIEAKEIHKNVCGGFPLIPQISFKVTLFADLVNFCHIFQKLNLCRNLYHCLLIRVNLDLEYLFLSRLFLQIDHVFEFKHEREKQQVYRERVQPVVFRNLGPAVPVLQD